MNSAQVAASVLRSMSARRVSSDPWGGNPAGDRLTRSTAARRSLGSPSTHRAILDASATVSGRGTESTRPVQYSLIQRLH